MTLRFHPCPPVDINRRSLSDLSYSTREQGFLLAMPKIYSQQQAIPERKAAIVYLLLRTKITFRSRKPYSVTVKALRCDFRQFSRIVRPSCLRVRVRQVSRTMPGPGRFAVSAGFGNLRSVPVYGEDRITLIGPAQTLPPGWRQLFRSTHNFRGIGGQDGAGILPSPPPGRSTRGTGETRQLP